MKFIHKKPAKKIILTNQLFSKSNKQTKKLFLKIILYPHNIKFETENVL
jgi:hypothetical protein